MTTSPPCAAATDDWMSDQAERRSLLVGIEDGDQVTSVRSMPSRRRLMPTSTS